MALIKCPNCGHEISDKAEKCPHCGINLMEFLEEQKNIKEQEEKRKQEEREKKEREEKEKIESQIICPECKNSIDKGCVICPICAYPIKDEVDRKNKQKIKIKKIVSAVIIIVIIAIVMIMSLFFLREKKEKEEKYSQANNYYESDQFDKAVEIYNQLSDYKKSKSKCKIAKLGKQLQEADNLISQNIITEEDITFCDNILSETKEYSKLKKIRNTVVNKVYDKAAEYKFSSNDLEGSLERKYELAKLVEEDKDISQIEEIYVDYKAYNNAIKELEKENYKAAYDECVKISDNNEVPSTFKNSYKQLYENCSPFIGAWKTEEYLGDWFEISLAYSKDEHDAQNYGELEMPYLRLSVAGSSMANEALTGDDTGNCYKNLTWGDGKISFEYHDNGSQKPYHKVECSILDNNPKVYLDGKECNLFTPQGEKADSEKQEPYIGMSAYDAEYNCTWGKPSKKNITETQSGKSEQWVFSGYGYLYIENDRIVALQK